MNIEAVSSNPANPCGSQKKQHCTGCLWQQKVVARQLYVQHVPKQLRQSGLKRDHDSLQGSEDELQYKVCSSRQEWCSIPMQSHEEFLLHNKRYFVVLDNSELDDVESNEVSLKQCEISQELGYDSSLENLTFPDKISEQLSQQSECSNNCCIMKNYQQPQQQLRYRVQPQQQQCGQHSQPNKYLHGQQQLCTCRRQNLTRKISNVEVEELKPRSSFSNKNRTPLRLEQRRASESKESCSSCSNCTSTSPTTGNRSCLSTSRISFYQPSVDLSSTQVNNQSMPLTSSSAEHLQPTSENSIRRLSLVKNNIWVNEENIATESESKTASGTKSNPKSHPLIRGLCILGWVLCCPCWTIGFTLREQPVDSDEGFDDPCWPC